MTKWVRTGTITVTNGSNTITGVGTSWLESVNIGWTFVGPDKVTNEVAAVVSDTEITLHDNYTAATASGASYAIVPSQGLNRDLTIKAQNLLDEFRYAVVAFRNAAAFFATQAVMLSDPRDYDDFSENDIVWAAGIPYQVAAQDAVDEDLESSAGVKYYSSFANSNAVGAPIEGPEGPGWTGVTYDQATGFLTFASDDGIGYTSADIRGGDAYQVWLEDGNTGTRADFLDDISAEAVGLAQAAQAAAEAAQTAAENAKTSIVASEASTTANAALAQKWATEQEDTVVVSGLYSALHHAAKSSDSAASAIAAKLLAENYRNAAQAALTSVENIFDNFDDRFLGTKTANPTTDNDGNAILPGAVYYNSTNDEVMFYNGAAWESPSSAATTAATNAASSALAASNSAASAATSASSASNSEIASAGHETNSSTSATNASSSAAAAATSAASAETAENNATTSASLSQSWATGTVDTEVASGLYSALHYAAKALAAQAASEAARDVALTAETDSQTAQSLAETALASAVTAKNAAESAESAASTSETNAAQSASSAGTYATNASASSTAAAVAEDKAQEWAEANEDVEVETGLYSAKHHRIKAAVSAANAASSETTVSTAATAAQVARTAAESAQSAAESAESAAVTAKNDAETARDSAETFSVSAGLSATSATNSAATATAAKNDSETALDDMRTIYIGKYASDAAASSSGFTITDGVFYLNTTTNTLRIRADGSWGTSVLDAAGFMSSSNNLSDLSDNSAARANLELGTAAVADTGDFATSAQGTLADNALPKSGGTLTNSLIVDTDGTFVNTSSGLSGFAVNNGGASGGYSAFVVQTGVGNVIDARNDGRVLFSGDIIIEGTVDGRNVAADGALLDTSYGWGDHAGLYASTSHTHIISDITDFPTLGTAAAADLGDFIPADDNVIITEGHGVIKHNGTQQRHVLAAGGGYLRLTGSPVGAIAIKLPDAISETNDMVSFWVDVYDYGNEETFSVQVGGYAQASGGWLNTTANIIGTNLTRDLTVRFGNDGTNHWVWIGEVDSAWAYINAIVRDVVVGHLATTDAYVDGWAMSMVTSFHTVNVTKTENLIVSKYAKDAGTLDGNLPAAFAMASHSHPISSITNLPDMFNNMGGTHTSNSSFGNITDFGFNYVSSASGGPTAQAGSEQFYGVTLGLGSEYAYSAYANQIAWQRNTADAPYLWNRNRENGTWASWRKFSAGYADDSGTLDGNLSTAFATAAQGVKADAAMPKSGGIFTGDITTNGELRLGQQKGVIVDWVPNQKNPVFTMKNYPNFGLFWKEGSPDTFQIATANETTDFALEISRDVGLTRKGNLVWDAGNHGAGSGMDADLLDGNEATAFVLSSEKGAANGIATLDAQGFIPSAQLPAYIDDLIEVADFASLPTTGEGGKIYLTLDDNYQYRWGGSAYADISNGGAASSLVTARTISLSGDASGSVSFDGTANVDIAVTVADDSHAHTISNIDGLQTALDNAGGKGDWDATTLTHTAGAVSVDLDADHQFEFKTTDWFPGEPAFKSLTPWTSVNSANSMQGSYVAGDLLIRLYLDATVLTTAEDSAGNWTRIDSKSSTGFAAFTRIADSSSVSPPNITTSNSYIRNALMVFGQSLEPLLDSVYFSSGQGGSLLQTTTAKSTVDQRAFVYHYLRDATQGAGFDTLTGGDFAFANMDQEYFNTEIMGGVSDDVIDVLFSESDTAPTRYTGDDFASGNEINATNVGAQEYQYTFGFALSAGAASGVKDYDISFTNKPVSGYRTGRILLETTNETGVITFADNEIWLNEHTPDFSVVGRHIVEYWVSATETILKYHGQEALLASADQGAKADAAFAWGDHAVEGYLTTTALETVTVTDTGGTVAIDPDAGGRFVFEAPAEAPGNVTVFGEVKITGPGPDNLPAGVQTGDVVFIEAFDIDPVTLPAGYTQVASASPGYDWASGYKVMGATPDTQVASFLPSGGGACVTVLRGVNVTSLFDIATVATVGDSLDPPAFTPVADGALASLSVFGYIVQGGGFGLAYTEYNNGWTRQTFNYNLSSNGKPYVGHFTKPFPTGGVTDDPPSPTITGSYGQVNTIVWNPDTNVNYTLAFDAAGDNPKDILVEFEVASTYNVLAITGGTVSWLGYEPDFNLLGVYKIRALVGNGKTILEYISGPENFGYASIAQGALADSAVQPADLGTAAAQDIGDFASAAQGTLADSAVQPADLGTASAEDLAYFATAAQGAKADSAVQPFEIARAGLWDDAYGWGDHAAENYLTAVSWGDVTGKPVFFDGAYSSLSGAPTLGTAAATDATAYATAAQGVLAANAMPKSGGTFTGGIVAPLYGATSTNYRVKYRVWDNADYGMGMGNGYTFGHLDDDYAITFQMSNTVGRGFWWGNVAHGNHEGAMSLTAHGKLHVGTSISVGNGLDEVFHEGNFTDNSTNWDTAYGWGNHASAGYATGAQGVLADSAVQPNEVGTSAALDVAAAGDASTTQVVKGNDTRLSNARTPIAHTHTKSDISDFAHTHLKSDITDFAHTHTKADITNYPAAVSGSEITSGTETGAREMSPADVVSFISQHGSGGGGGSGLTYTGVTANTTAVSGNGYICNTSGGAFTVTLPASPTIGDFVVVLDATGDWETNNLTVARNGATIEGSASDLVCNVKDLYITIIYTGSTWQFYAEARSADLAATNGDMAKSVYDTNNNGVVDEAATLTGFTDNSSNWNTAYGWGDHGLAGYISGYTVTAGDVTAHQGSISITESQITDFGTYLTSVSWGDVTGKPAFGVVATTNDYDDLSNKPVTNKITVGTSAPSSPSVGDLWVDTN